MQRYTIFFIIVNALLTPGHFSTPSSGAQNCTHSNWYVPSLLAATASVGELELDHVPDPVCKVLELLTMGGETARNM